MLDEPVKPVHAPAGLVQLTIEQRRRRGRGVNVEELEVVPGFEHQNPAGHASGNRPPKKNCAKVWKRPSITAATSRSRAKDGSAVEGYIFDRRTGATLADSCVRLFPEKRPEQAHDPLFRYRRPCLYRPRYRRRQELGSLAEEVLGKEARRRNQHRAQARKARLDAHPNRLAVIGGWMRP